MQKEYYFKSPVYVEQNSFDIENLIKLTDDYIVKEKNKDIDKIKKRNESLGDVGDIGWEYHSEPLYLDKNFINFHTLLKKKSIFILNDMGYDIEQFDLICTESWVQEFSEKGFGNHYLHTHPNNHISGFLFLKINEKTSFPFFTDPRTSHSIIKLPEKNANNITDASDYINFKPVPGTLIMFPSYLSHGFQVDFGLQPFRFIHFNYRAIEKKYLKDNYEFI